MGWAEVKAIGDVVVKLVGQARGPGCLPEGSGAVVLRSPAGHSQRHGLLLHILNQGSVKPDYFLVSGRAQALVSAMQAFDGGLV